MSATIILTKMCYIGINNFINFKQKMAQKSNHVVPSKSDGWAVKKSGSVKASRNFDTKVKAVKYAIELSKNEKTELYIHKANGMIQNRNSYGNDPNPPKDKK